MLTRFNKKVVLVTGAAQGIGRACAEAFAAEGAQVVLSDINGDAGEKITHAIRDTGGKAIFVRADVSESEEVEKMTEEIVRQHGRLDVAVNNAGIRGKRMLLSDLSEDAWDAVLKINLKGVWLSMKYEIPEMLKNGGGAIVNVSSMLGLVGLRKLSAYTASKHAVLGLTRATAEEYAAKGIRTNAVCPGYIDTPLLEQTVAGKKRSGSFMNEIMRGMKKTVGYAALSTQTPLGRFGTPEEVAQTVVWLCSDAACEINGQAISIDGGYVAK